jgi:hypothetical protein
MGLHYIIKTILDSFICLIHLPCKEITSVKNVPVRRLLKGGMCFREEDEVRRLAEEIFELSVDERSGRGLVVVEDVWSGKCDLDTLKQAVFERILLREPGRCVRGGAPSTHAVQPHPILYLFESYKRLQALSSTQATAQLSTALLQNAATALAQPDLFHPQQIHKQV